MTTALVFGAAGGSGGGPRPFSCGPGLEDVAEADALRGRSGSAGVAAGEGGLVASGGPAVQWQRVGGPVRSGAARAGVPIAGVL